MLEFINIKYLLLYPLREEAAEGYPVDTPA